MSLSHLCLDCLPEGSDLHFADLKAGPPHHCHGRNDTTCPGLIGGFRCSCECNRTSTRNGSTQDTVR